MILPFVMAALIGLMLLSALMWSVWRTVTERGWLGLSHLAAALGLVATLALIVTQDAAMGPVLGWGLVAAGLAATSLEASSGRLFPLIYVAFGLITGLALPFQGG